jgi:hypothetical protein
LLPLLLPFNAAFQRCFCCYCCCCCCCCSSIDTGVAAVVVQSTPHSRAFPLLLTAAPPPCFSQPRLPSCLTIFVPILTPQQPPA